MSLNQEQQEYVNSLAAIPDENRCWCGWYRLDQCPNCDKSSSLADRLKVSCKHKQCRNYPRQGDPEGTIIHNIACPDRISSSMETISADDWSKLLTIAEYGVWSEALPKIKDMFADEETSADPAYVAVQEIVDSLPQNLQDVGKILMTPHGYHQYKPTSAKVMAALFLAKVSPPKPPAVT